MGPRTSISRAYLAEHHPQIVASSRSRPQPGEIAASAGQGQRVRIAELLRTHAGNVSKVARELGEPRAQVYRWMRGLGLTAQKFRK
jgi:transcriptional regulator of acetoin/glycerol metabolism